MERYPLARRLSDDAITTTIFALANVVVSSRKRRKDERTELLLIQQRTAISLSFQHSKLFSTMYCEKSSDRLHIVVALEGDVTGRRSALRQFLEHQNRTRTLRFLTVCTGHCDFQVLPKSLACSRARKIAREAAREAAHTNATEHAVLMVRPPSSIVSTSSVNS